MAMKIGRNDPCPCGSGRKYKHCCLIKEQETAHARKAAEREQISSTVLEPPSPPATVPAEDLAAEAAASAPPPVDPVVEAIDAVYDAFEAADDEGRIALFYRTLEEGELMDGEMAFDMLSEINQTLIKRGERGRLDDMVAALQERLPAVYDEERPYFLKWRITHAVAGGHWDAVGALVREFSTLAGDHIDLYLGTLDQLAYHGQLSLLVEAVRIAWPSVKGASGIFDWAIENFGVQAAYCVIFDDLERNPAATADDPALLAGLEDFFEFDQEWLTNRLTHLTGQARGAWTREDFKSGHAEYRQNLIDLSFEFVRHLRREKGVPYCKGDLAREQICEYLLKREQGKLGKQDRKLKITPLCPDHATLDYFLGVLLNMINFQIYKAVATLELMPAWLDFLASRQLIADNAPAQILKPLAPLHASLLQICDEYDDDPALALALKSWP